MRSAAAAIPLVIFSIELTAEEFNRVGTMAVGGFGVALQQPNGGALSALDAMKPALEELRGKLTEGGPKSPADARAGGPLLAAFLARFS